MDMSVEEFTYGPPAESSPVSTDSNVEITPELESTPSHGDGGSTSSSSSEASQCSGIADGTHGDLLEVDESTIPISFVPPKAKNRDKSRPKNLRGERAIDLAWAMRVKFGQREYSEAQRQTVYRWASEHKLVTDPSLRNVDKVKVLRQAVVAYFTVSDNDLVDEFAIFSKRNKKRTKQLNLARK
jgi:hypothetical protein